MGGRFSGFLLKCKKFFLEKILEFFKLWAGKFHSSKYKKITFFEKNIYKKFFPSKCFIFWAWEIPSWNMGSFLILGLESSISQNIRRFFFEKNFFQRGSFFFFFLPWLHDVTAWLRHLQDYNIFIATTYVSAGLFVNLLQDLLLTMEILYLKLSNTSFLNILKSVQYDAVLAVTVAIKGTSFDKLYQELGLEYVRQWRWMRRLCFIFKALSTEQPSYIHDLLSQMRNVTNAPTLSMYFFVELNAWKIIFHICH